jgi:3'-phosphoadenosine 5'-phosphosulfate sulfotransferase (PAPS reductase)/FAD synthetase
MAAATLTRDPFRIDTRTAISVSGGRTSAYMLHRVLRSNGGRLPADAVAMFANTGKEEEATLRFVRDMGERWGVPIQWIEYRPDDVGFALVDFESASRNGEPFEAMVKKERFLPSPVQRICTSRLKVRVMHRYFRTLGWFDDDDGWDQMIGIRADEHRRVSKIRQRGTSTETVKETMVVPLADVGVTLAEVADFWRAQPFQLDLYTDPKGRTLGGNCDLCFLKPAAQIMSLIAEKPQRAVWWARMEAHAEAEWAEKRSADYWRFRNDRPTYAQMAAFVRDQRVLFDPDEEAIPCLCGD